MSQIKNSKISVYNPFSRKEILDIVSLLPELNKNKLIDVFSTDINALVKKFFELEYVKRLPIEIMLWSSKNFITTSDFLIFSLCDTKLYLNDDIRKHVALGEVLVVEGAEIKSITANDPHAFLIFLCDDTRNQFRYVPISLPSYCVESQGLRSNMEDFMCHATAPDFELWGVFDGHGGEQISKLASTHLPRYVYNCIANKKYPMISNRIKKAFSKFDKFIWKNELIGGSTANILIEYKNQYFSVNLGDSKMILIDLEKERQIFETQDHDPTSQLEHERICNAGGYVLNGRANGLLSVSRSFGDFLKDTNKYNKNKIISAEPDIYTLGNADNLKNKIAVLASDGVWNVNKTSSISSLVVKMSQEPELLCHEILNNSVSSYDNVTVMVVVFD